MEMCYDGALVLPSSYAVMDEEEMTYVEGGAELAVSTKYLNKKECLSVARNYTEETGMSNERIAKEIYAHAVLYYASPVAYASMLASVTVLLGPIGVVGATAAFSYIRSHSNPINLGNDNEVRVAVYNALWNL